MRFFNELKPQVTDDGAIRKVREEDLIALEWDGEYRRFRNVYQDVYRQYLAGKALLWVVEINGYGIIGQIFAQLLSENTMLADGRERAYLFSFRVKPEFQGRGWGTRLLYNAEYDLAQRGFIVALLNVSKTNVQAREFYERRGYQIVGEDRGEWSYIDHLGQRQMVVDPSWRMEKGLKNYKKDGERY